jgi:hypothetical protein
MTVADRWSTGFTTDPSISIPMHSSLTIGAAGERVMMSGPTHFHGAGPPTDPANITAEIIGASHRGKPRLVTSTPKPIARANRPIHDTVSSGPVRLPTPWRA